MALDPSIILGYKPPQVDSPLNALGEAFKVKSLQQQGDLGALQLQEGQRTAEETRQTAEAYKTALNPDGTINRNNLYTDLAKRGLGAKLPGVQKGFADADKSATETDAAKFKLANERYSTFQKTMGALKDAPNLSKQLLMETGMNLVQQGILPKEMYDGAVANMPDDVAQLRQRLTQGLATQMSPEKIFEVFAPKAEKIDNGGSISFRDTNPNSPTFGQATGGAPIAKEQGPDSKASIAAQRQNHLETLKKDYTLAGMNPDGTSTGSNDSMIDAIGTYKVAPPNGMALRNPRMQQILAEVTAKYPDFDATTYGARQQAAKSFGTGKDGQSVQSANTALNHLGTLRELAEAQDNGDIRLFNTIANRFATETGGSKPTNLAAAVTMVGPEISKAVIGAGGGQGDREKVDSALAALTKGGKGQAAGTLATMEDLFGGRLTEAKRTYERTTGRKDFTDVMLSPAAQRVLAARTGGGAGAAPQIDRSAIAAELARRRVK